MGGGGRLTGSNDFLVSAYVLQYRINSLVTSLQDLNDKTFASNAGNITFFLKRK